MLKKSLRSPFFSADSAIKSFDLMTSPAHPSAIARYYDQNTARFLRLGGSGAAAAIHRAVWAPGVTSAEDAFLYLNRLVAAALAPLASQPVARLLDLGCGVGGSATWMAEALPASVVGVTNSPVQAALAAQRAAAIGLSGRCQFVLADFHHLPEMGSFQGAWAIEALAHSHDPALFFQQAATRLAPGGRLVICDDFLSHETTPSARAGQWIERFRRGWHLGSLLTLQDATLLAGQAGLRLAQADDLTPHLHSFHPLVLSTVLALTRLPLRSAYWHNLSGGAALQVCLKNGWTQYQALVFEKTG